MGYGSELPDDEITLHRFNPKDPDHTAEPDDGSPPRLRQLAFIWSDSESGMHLETSIYQDSKLAKLGLTRPDTLDVDHKDWDLASAKASEIRALKRASVPEQDNPLRLVEHEYPEGKVGAARRDGAHGEVIYPKAAAGKKAWLSLLAHAFTVDSLYSE